jgi:hypothetical protein
MRLSKFLNWLKSFVRRSKPLSWLESHVKEALEDTHDERTVEILMEHIHANIVYKFNQFEKYFILFLFSAVIFSMPYIAPNTGIKVLGVDVSDIKKLYPALSVIILFFFDIMFFYYTTLNIQKILYSSLLKYKHPVLYTNCIHKLQHDNLFLDDPLESIFFIWIMRFIVLLPLTAIILLIIYWPVTSVFGNGDMSYQVDILIKNHTSDEKANAIFHILYFIVAVGLLLFPLLLIATKHYIVDRRRFRIS